MRKFVVIFRSPSVVEPSTFVDFLRNTYGGYEKTWPIYDNAMVIKSETETTDSIFNTIEKFRKEYPQDTLDRFDYLVFEIAQSDKEKEENKEHPVEMKGYHLVNFHNWLNGCQ